jgi:hypothetical protein
MCRHSESQLSARRDFLKLGAFSAAATGASTFVTAAPVLGQQATAGRVSEQQVHQLINAWPAKCKQVALWMVEHHGPPNEATLTHLVWHKNGPWKWSIVYSDEVPHNFPVKHTDMLDQGIDYKVPADKMDELAEFDGAVTVRITKGEMAAMCDKEANNFLAINLAHEIVTGKRTVAEARDFQTKVIKASLKGETHDYLQKFVFELPKGETGYSDQVADG